MSQTPNLPGIGWSPEQLLPEHYPEHCPGSDWGLDESFWTRVARGAPTFCPDDESDLRSPTARELCSWWTLVWPLRIYDRVPKGKKLTYGQVFEIGIEQSLRLLAGNWVGWAREDELRHARQRLQAARTAEDPFRYIDVKLGDVPKEILDMMKEQEIG